MKTIEALMRKGYNYDKIKIKLAESGILDEWQKIKWNVWTGIETWNTIM